MDNLMDRARFNISQLRGSEDGQLPDDLYVTNMLKRSGKTVSDMDRQMIMKMLSEGMPKEMVIQNILQESGRTMSGMDRAMVGGLGSVATPTKIKEENFLNKIKRFPDYQKERPALEKNMPRLAKLLSYIPDPNQLVSFLNAEYGLDLMSLERLTEQEINKIENDLEKEQKQGMSGGGEALKQIPEGNKGLPNLPEDVRNSMGYFQDGGEAIDSELAGMQMSEEDAMSEVASLDNPEMKMIEQLIAVVQQLMAQGVSEQEIKMFLKEQGLDDEDINTLFEMLSESDMQQQGAGQIDQQLQGMM